MKMENESTIKSLWNRKQGPIAGLAIVAIATHFVLRFVVNVDGDVSNYPLYLTLLLGGSPLVLDLLVNVIKREFGSDLLAGIAIVTSVLLGEYLAGAFVVLMLSGGEAIEAFAVTRASSVLRALANRMPSRAFTMNPLIGASPSWLVPKWNTAGVGYCA